jgi:hypothetical protein
MPWHSTWGSVGRAVYEPDPLQTSFIAALVPLTGVYWWNHHLKVAKLISVHHHA